MDILDPKLRQQQLTYIAQLGADSDFTLNTDAPPRAEFSRLAMDFLGWVSCSLVVGRDVAYNVERFKAVNNGADTGGSAFKRNIGIHVVVATLKALIDQGRHQQCC